MTKAKEKKDRAFLIADGIVGVSHHLGNRAVFVYPVIDFLLLYFQRPHVIRIWRDGQLIFSSLQDPWHSRHLHILDSPHESNLVPLMDGSAYRLSVDQIKDGRLESAPNFAKETADILQQAREMGQGSGTTEIGSILCEALEEVGYLQGRNGNSHDTRPETIGDDEVELMLGPMRRVLDEAFADAATSPQLKSSGKTDLGLLNIFCAVRTVRGPGRRFPDPSGVGVFNYTASLLLSQVQRRMVSAWCARGRVVEDLRKPQGVSCPDEHVVSLEIPLGPHSRSIADGSFTSGNVQFGLEPGEKGWDVADDEPDKLRQKVEEHIYGAVYKPWPPHVFNIPIHVGGCPWLVAFTFTEKQPSVHSESWRHNYYLYRDVLPKAAALIRSQSWEIFSQQIRQGMIDVFAAGGKSAEGIAELVTLRWRKLAQIYPFPVFDLALSTHGGALRPEEIEIPGRGRFKITHRTNPFLPKQVDFAPIDARKVIESLAISGKNFGRIEVRSKAIPAHTLGIPLARLKSISMQLGDREIERGIRAAIDEIESLNLFTTGMLDEEKARHYREASGVLLSCADFATFVDQEITKTLDTLSCDKVYQRADLVRSALKDNWLHLKIGPVSEPLSNLLMRFYPEQLKCVLHALLANAFHYNPNGVTGNLAPFISVALLIARDQPVYVEVKSQTLRKPDDLEKLARLASQGAPDWIGISTIHMACHICNYERPSWTPMEGGKLAAKLQIGAMS